MSKQYKYSMKPLFEERMRSLLPDSSDFARFSEIIHREPLDFIRCNTLKTSPQELLIKLKKKWQVEQPFSNHSEIMLFLREFH